jgi:hypothetical protein
MFLRNVRLNTKMHCVTTQKHTRVNLIFSLQVYVHRPPLWSSGQSSWLQIRSPGFDSRHYQKKVVGLERGPLSIVSTTQEILGRKVAAPL